MRRGLIFERAQISLGTSTQSCVATKRGTNFVTCLKEQLNLCSCSNVSLASPDGLHVALLDGVVHYHGLHLVPALHRALV